MICRFERLEIEIVKGDITDTYAEGIVNAANTYLKHGGGVAYAIVKKGGIEIQKESDEYVRKNGPLNIGDVAITGPGKLNFKYIIHAVGPRFGEGDHFLFKAIENAIKKADDLYLSSIAIPAISTGSYGYPYDRCANIMIQVIKNYNTKNLKKIFVVLYDNDAFNSFRELFQKNFNCF